MDVHGFLNGPGMAVDLFVDYLFGAIYLGALVVVYDSCLVVFGSLSLGFPSAVLNVLVPFEVYLYAFLFEQFPELFSCVWHVWNYNGDVLFFVGWWIVVVVGGGMVEVGKFVLPLAECPVWKLIML